MLRNILTAIVVLSLILVAGCSGTAGTQHASAPPKIIRQAVLGSDWKMKQMQIELEVDSETSILFKLADGDKVDGYFYLEDGDNLDFEIVANYLIYKSKPKGDTGEVISDRFSFVASQEQGNTYALNFHNTAEKDEKQKKVTVFLEVIYPVTGSIFVPLKSE